METDVGYAELLHLDGPLHLVRYVDHVNLDLGTVLPCRHDRFRYGGVIGKTQNSDDVCSCFRSYLHFETARIHGLGVGDDLPSGIQLPECTYRFRPLALDERCSYLDPIGAACDGLLAYPYAPFQLHEVQCDLKYGPHVHAIVVVPFKFASVE